MRYPVILLHYSISHIVLRGRGRVVQRVGPALLHLDGEAQPHEEPAHLGFIVCNNTISVVLLFSVLYVY